MTKNDQLFRIMAALDDRWRQLRRHGVRMCDPLALAQLTVAGEPLTRVTARKLEGYV